jgi:hypothetical protein
VAVHVTVVLPIGNVDPLAGAHVTVTGAFPPLTVGDAYVTLVAADAVTSDTTGHVACGGGVGVDAGAVGLLLQLQIAAVRHVKKTRPNPGTRIR